MNRKARTPANAPPGTPYDVAIVGGGLIGGSLACALRRSGLKVALIEAAAPEAEAHPSYDERAIALSWGSRVILEAMGLWGAMGPDAAPIERIHISDRGRFGFSRLDRSELGVPALGYVAAARAMGAAIREGLKAPGAPDLLCPARVLGQRIETDRVEIRVSTPEGERALEARLLVAADGGDSAMRAGLGIECEEHPYGHDAIVATLTPERPAPGVAFERFTETGPLAMLPMTQGRYSMVWTCHESETAEILTLADSAFLGRLQERFGWRLGRLALPSTRRAYPLKLALARDSVRPRAVLIGNAAHTLHPVGGQGFNLGLRDVAALAEVLVDAAGRGEDPGAPETLAAYKAWRARDQEAMARITDGLARFFVNPWAPLRMARDLGLIGLDLVPPARRLLARRFMGLGGRLPRLARGLPLLAPTSHQERP
jgi:2-octaprenyl-6-methoxyphenol hydroxylase